MKTRLILEQAARQARSLRLSARLIHADGSDDLLWWELPQEWEGAVTPWADPWVVGLIFPVMQRGGGVHIEGCVSPSLLANLELFTQIWAIWSPARYRPVSFTADIEMELPPVADPGLAVAAFSGGIDSCFSVHRHTQRTVGRRGLRLGAGVVQHGFDIWLDQSNSAELFAGLLSDATAMLGSVGLPCIPLRTNFQQLRLVWADAFGSQLVSGLSLLARRFDSALIANDMPYDALENTWASHPVTNPLLGSRGFVVTDDGGDHSRIDKAKAISAWPQAMRHLHVCFDAYTRGRYENCCACEKCVRTILAFRVAGCARPESFKRDVSDVEIRNVRVDPASDIIRQWEKLAQGAEAAGMGQTGWARALRALRRTYRWRLLRNRWQQPFVPLRNRVRWLMRGTTLSRSELARQQRDDKGKVPPERRL